MSGESTPSPLAIEWAPEARSEVRGIDRQTALEILHCIGHYLRTRSGDVKKLKPPLTGLRLRCGDYRVFFELERNETVTVTSVRHRSRAYR